MSVTLKPQVEFLRAMKGKALIVLRPEDPARAIARAEKIAADQKSGAITGEEASRQMQAMLHEQIYRVAGYPYEQNGEVMLLDADKGEVIGQFQNGDSFVQVKRQGKDS